MLVPQHPEHFRRWAADSADVMRTQECEVDVRYGGGPNEHLDIFPAAQADAPVLVFIHGGYWRSFDKRDHSFVAPAFTRRGVCVVVPNYALCPAVTVPQIVMQLVHALAWTWRHIGRHGGDPRRITVAGHSAGGHLAAMMLACLWPVYGHGPAGGPGEERVVDLRAVRPGSDHAHAVPSAVVAADRRAGAHGQPGAAAGAGAGPAGHGLRRRRERGVPAPEPPDPRGLGRRKEFRSARPCPA